MTCATASGEKRARVPFYKRAADRHSAVFVIFDYFDDRLFSDEKPRHPRTYYNYHYYIHSYKRSTERQCETIILHNTILHEYVVGFRRYFTNSYFSFLIETVDRRTIGRRLYNEYIY